MPSDGLEGLDGGGMREAQEWGGIRMLIADSRCWTAEANTT